MIRRPTTSTRARAARLSELLDGPTIAWAGVLAALVGFRVGLPLAVKAHAGSALPLLPLYEYIPLNGDANG